MKRVVVLGSTGSIGTQTLEVAELLGNELRVVGLAAKSNVDLLFRQAFKFKPLVVAMQDSSAAAQLRLKFQDSGLDIPVLEGAQGVADVATLPEADTVVAAMVGIAGLVPVLRAIEAGKNVALANKETLVAAGELVTQTANEKRVQIIPVDSEHSAVYQCLNGRDSSAVSKVFITGSGGPFRTWSADRLADVTPDQALKHPNWSMGPKVTIDSATLMNKGLEVIEARWLFNLKWDQIKVIIHPQSIVHSLVEFKDGSVLGQLGLPDMRLPIIYALAWPKRVETRWPKLNLVEISALTFELPDPKKFPCLDLAYEAGKAGGTMPAVLNAANEAAVNMFLNGIIRFTDIYRIIRKVMDKHILRTPRSVEDILEADSWARKESEKEARQ